MPILQNFSVQVNRAVTVKVPQMTIKAVIYANDGRTVLKDYSAGVDLGATLNAMTADALQSWLMDRANEILLDSAGLK